MAENDAVPENLTFLLGNDPGDESDAGAPPEGEAPAPEATPQSPEFAPQEAVQPQDDPNERRFRGVLNELRDTRQELRAYREEAAALKAERERRALEAEAPAPPDKDADPAAWLAWQQQQAVDDLRREMYEKEEYARQEYETQQMRGQFFGTVAEQENAFRAQVSDYDQAVAFTKDLRARELEGFGLTPEQVDYQLKKELIGFSALNLGNGRSPAQAAYDYAVSRGYRSQAQAPQPPVYQQAPSYQPPVPQQRVHQSLSAVTGSGGGRGVTLQNLAEQDARTQTAIMDDPDLWMRVNLGETVYV